ncbi:hypothetical protein [Geodermatophilus sp. URMC 64]
MSENDSAHSGSRREPGTTPQPAPAPTWQPPQAPPQAGPTPEPPRTGRGRAAVAAAALGLVAAGGLGGFVIGQASSGNAATDTGVVQDVDPSQEGGVPGQFPGDHGSRPDFGTGTPPDFDGDVDGDDDGAATAPDGTDQGTAGTDQSTT